MSSAKPLTRQRWTRAAVARSAPLSLWLAGIGLVLMTAFVAWQVFGRYVLNHSPSWTEPGSVMLMSWFIFLGAAVGVRENYHLGFDVLLYVLPHRRQAVAAHDLRPRRPRLRHRHDLVRRPARRA